MSENISSPPVDFRHKINAFSQHNSNNILDKYGVCLSDSTKLAIPKVSVIIPTFNEATNLEYVLPKLPDWLHEIIVVDGRSTDGTVEVAKHLRPNAQIVMESRKGKGAALRAGFCCATGDVIVIIDADGSMNPGEMILLIGALLAGADFAKGSRFIEGGGSSDLSMFRTVGNWALTKVVRCFYHCRFSDLCYGYIAFWRRSLPLLECRCDGFEIEAMLCVRALLNGLKITEVASWEARRVHGESNLRAVPDGWRVLKTIMGEWRSGHAMQGHRSESDGSEPAASDIKN